MIVLVLNESIMKINVIFEVGYGLKLIQVWKIPQLVILLSEGGANETVAVKPKSMVGACFKIERCQLKTFIYNETTQLF